MHRDRIGTDCFMMLIAAILLTQHSVTWAAPSVNQAMLAVAAAKQFALGGIGVAGTMSEGERQLRAVLQASDASPQLQSALAQATPAGRLYILVGLRRCDSAAYQKIFPRLLRSKEEVEVIRGCIISREPFEKLLSEVNDGRFDLYLSQPAR
jgi:hypothetical protein